MQFELNIAPGDRSAIIRLLPNSDGGNIITTEQLQQTATFDYVLSIQAKTLPRSPDGSVTVCDLKEIRERLTDSQGTNFGQRFYRLCAP